MAHFDVKVVEIADVIDHPNADRLSLVKIGGFSVVSGKLEDGSHRYKAGDLVVYVPENALVPEYLLKQGYWDEAKGKGFLSGPLGNRVKPVRLRGILSEGIMFPVDNSFDTPMIKGDSNNIKPVSIGDDVAEFLGIVKWEPEVPTHMGGDLRPETGTIKYDIENIKKNPLMFTSGEDVYITEKIHGTNCQIGYFPKFTDEHLFLEKYFVASKGLGGKHLAFKKTEKNAEGNLYVRALLENIEKFERLATFFSECDKVIYFGEIFGKGVQDLNYNAQKPELRIFDIWVDGSYLDFKELDRVCTAGGLNMVPVLYWGPYSREVVEKYTDGTTLINGAHIREGCVIKPTTERLDYSGERVIAKSVSEAYLTRKGNQTEYQ